MATANETIDQSAFSLTLNSGAPVPGLLLVFSSGEPLSGAFALEAPLQIGRESLSGVELHDSRMSRNHATVAYENGQWVVTDLGSRNGTAVDGEPIVGTVRSKDFRVLRAGKTLFLFIDDVRPFLKARMELSQNAVLGPRMQLLFQQIKQAASTGILHITGETGAGKEIAARAFHDFGPNKQGPFIAVNCATIPEGVAERLLFGAKKGAYSGANVDAVGYVQEADGGTLFLDEVGELSPSVQAKLLRVVETREVLPLGASRGRKVELMICSATHRDLRDNVAEGAFREDLFYRLGRPKVSLLSLREHPEDIPFLVDRQLRHIGEGLEAHVLFMEACLLRPWPGNVRELIAEVRDAALAAQVEARSTVLLTDLASDSGLSYSKSSALAEENKSAQKRASMPPQERIEAALQKSGGRVATAARELGVHRNQLRRWLEKNGVDPSRYSDSDSVS